MALISKFFKPDLALVCIGGHFTMDPEHAAYALSELIRPKQVIPMHYGTFPVINRTPAELKAALGNSPIKVWMETGRSGKILRPRGSTRARQPCATPRQNARVLPDSAKGNQYEPLDRERVVLTRQSALVLLP